MSKRNPNRSSSNLISVTSRLLSQHLISKFDENKIDITLEQWTLLYYLWEKDGMTQNELAAQANKEKSTITRHIDALQKKELIRRDSHPSDKRNKIISLTEKGKACKKPAMQQAQEITQKIEEGISDEELHLFKNILSKMIQNLD